MSDLIPLYKQMAAEGGNFHGLSVLKYAASIAKLARSVGAKTMLDFGCGRGDAYSSPHKLHHVLGIRRPNVTLYDPAFPKHDKKPTGTYDLVVCSDVLEHVLEEDVPAFLDGLFARANKAVWLSVCTRAAKKTFPNSDINLHVTIRPYLWWHEQISRAAGGKAFILVETL